MTASPAARVEALEPCPFCGAQMLVRVNSAFHPNIERCWLGEAGENSSGYELDIEDFPSWNRRPALDAQARLIEEARKVVEQVQKNRASTFKSRNGRRVDVIGDDGEASWIVDHETMADLDAFLTTLPAKGGAT